MKLRFDQTTAWILASLVAVAAFGGIYSGLRFAAQKRAENAESSLEQNESGHRETVSSVLHNPESPAWGYHGALGPERWASLDERYAACGKHQASSPVDLGHGIPRQELKPLLFRYTPTGVRMAFNHGDLAAEVRDGGGIEYEGDYFPLVRISLHAPAEHHRAGVPFPVELQLEHRDASGQRIHLALFIEQAANQNEVNQNLAKILNHLPQENYHETEIDAVDWLGILPAKKTYVTYVGGMTYPPCLGKVRWVVFTDFILATEKQITALRTLTGGNARPLMPLQRREVLRSLR